jgi:hypothetical protein
MAKPTQVPSGLQAMLSRATAKPPAAQAAGSEDIAAALSEAKANESQARREREEAVRQRDQVQRMLEQLQKDGQVPQGTELLELDALEHPPWNCWSATTERTRTLANDIHDRGLIEPLVVDVDNVVLAGDNRLRALKLLATEQGEWFQETFARGIPVHRLDIRYKDTPFEAGLAQLAANFNREKPPTSQQLRPHLLRLLEQMPTDRYHFGRGNPHGKEPVVPVLMRAFGVSARTISRALAEQDDTAAEVESGTPGGSTKKPTRLVHFKRVQKQATGLLNLVRELPADARGPEMDEWLKATTRLQKQLDRLVLEERARRP